MKRNAIIRIVIFSFVIIFLLTILVSGLGIGMLLLDFGSVELQTYVTGKGSVPADEIRNLSIEWASGSVTIKTADTDIISFSETASENDVEEMVYSVDDETLVIAHSKPGIRVGFFSLSDKDLEITIPVDWKCNDLQIEAAAANVTVDGLNAATADLDMASGRSTFNDCTISSVEIDTASGNVEFSGTLDTLDCDAASADVTAILYNDPKSISMDSASGDLELTLPVDCGFTARLDSMSGDFFSEFSTTYDDKAYRFGDGTCKIELDCASGNIRIYKGE